MTSVPGLGGQPAWAQCAVQVAFLRRGSRPNITSRHTIHGRRPGNSPELETPSPTKTRTYARDHGSATFVSTRLGPSPTNRFNRVLRRAQPRPESAHRLGLREPSRRRLKVLRGQKTGNRLAGLPAPRARLETTVFAVPVWQSDSRRGTTRFPSHNGITHHEQCLCHRPHGLYRLRDNPLATRSRRRPRCWIQSSARLEPNRRSIPPTNAVDRG